jgi:predicted porin
MRVRERFSLSLFSIALLAAAGAQAQQAQIYGRLNTAVEHLRVGGTASLERLSSNRSVLGFRGEEDLGDGLKAIWQIEGSLSLDTGVGSPANRDTRLGLAGPWGTAFAGVWTLPYTSATSDFDAFYPTTAGYMALMGNGAASTTDHLIDRTAFDRRQQNQLQYWSPLLLGGLSAHLAYSPNEGEQGAGGARPSLGSASLSYADGPWTGVLAYEQHRHYQTAQGSDAAAKVALAYRQGPLKLGAIVERLSYGLAAGRLRRDSVYVSAAYRVGAVTGSVGLSRAGAGRGPAGTNAGGLYAGADTAAWQLTMGLDYAFSPRVSVYSYFSRLANESGAGYGLAINGLGSQRGADLSLLAAGLRYNF